MTTGRRRGIRRKRTRPIKRTCYFETEEENSNTMLTPDGCCRYFKKELPGRTMEFTFDLSQTPIIARRQKPRGAMTASTYSGYSQSLTGSASGYGSYSIASSNQLASMATGKSSSSDSASARASSSTAPDTMSLLAHGNLVGGRIWGHYFVENGTFCFKISCILHLCWSRVKTICVILQIFKEVTQFKIF